jgi:hypothetical protein
VPGADTSIVRHILYLDGYGRQTPYLSTTERTEVAAIFGARGRIWWPNAYEVLQAKRYAEQHFEHLFDFSGVSAEGIAGVVVKVFSKA